MHTLTDWELRQLLDETLDTARWLYLGYRAHHGKKRTQATTQEDWTRAATEAVQSAMDARWMDSTRPAAAD